MLKMGTTGVILTLWVGLVVVGFWWFEFRHWRTLDDALYQFDGHQLRLPESLKNQSGIKLVHYLDESCYCSLRQRQHLLDASWSSADLIQTVVKPGLIEGIEVPATPAVAIWNEQNELAYFGPYSAGGLCGVGQDFVSRVLQALSARKNPQWINTLAKGCYCPWPKEVMDEEQHVDATTL